MDAHSLDLLLREESDFEKGEEPRAILMKKKQDGLMDAITSGIFTLGMPLNLLVNSEQTPESFFSEVLKSISEVVVSRQDRYAPVPEHRHDWFELVYMYSGQCDLKVEGKALSLSEGECVLINIGSEHSCEACGTDDILVNFQIGRNCLSRNFFNRFSDSSFLSNFLILSLKEQNDSDGFIHFHSAPNSRTTLFLQEFLCEYYDRRTHSRDFLLNLLTLIFLELTEIYEQDRKDSQRSSRRQDVFTVLAYIENHAAECSLESAANHFHMNPNYFSGFIKAQTGYTYKELIQNSRLQTASLLLQSTEQPVASIAAEVGYHNLSFFYKIFKERFGCSPAEYRGMRKG